MVEIADAEYDTLTKANALLNGLLSDSKYGLPLEKAIKEKYPTANTSRLDTIEAVAAPFKQALTAQEAALADVQKQLADERAAREADKAERDMRSSLDKIQNKYGFTDDGMKDVIETARAENLAHNLDAAAAVYLQKQPKAKPISAASSYFPGSVNEHDRFSAESDEVFNLLKTDTNKFFEKQVASVFDEFNAA
jgi:hypothetical protein